jgi:Asp-tRNA(Asn)/Glu-tRNA(Gln) amidotransferase A subunit family amidase
VAGATITELQDAMSVGQATSAEITRAYLERIEAYDQQGPAINSMVWLNGNAVAEAEALDRERAERGPRGPMHGIPVILKDNYDTRDLPTTAGTLALAGFIPPDDAFQVARLREAGAVILGKANMEELASGITTISSMGGQTLNPYDLMRNPGGSSGGTGAAIAASFAAVGWGSDTCGSIRIPAAQNDLVGLRPTKGLSSIDGIVPLSHTQDVGGPLARTMRDLAIALDVVVGPDGADSATRILEGRELPNFTDALDAGALGGARIGILEEYFGSAPEEAAAGRIVRAAIDRMVELGADTVTVEIPDLSDLIAGSGVINYEFKWDLIDYLATSPAPPVASLEEMLGLGLIHQALVPRMRIRNAVESRDSEEYRGALARRGPLREAVEATMNRHSVDILVFPTVRTIPAVIGDPQRGSSCSLSANTGLPSLSVPAGFTADGLPIGIEMIGRTLDDARLVAIGYAFEQATDHRREPTSTPPLLDRVAPGPFRIALRAGAPEGAGVIATGVSIRGDLTLDAPRGELDFDLSLAGVASEDVYAIALRWPDGEGGWQVAHRLSGPGTAVASGRVRLTLEQRASLDNGEMHLIALTRQAPRGAAVALLVARD